MGIILRVNVSSSKIVMVRAIPGVRNCPFCQIFCHFFFVSFDVKRSKINFGHVRRSSQKCSFWPIFRNFLLYALFDLMTTTTLCYNSLILKYFLLSRSSLLSLWQWVKKIRLNLSNAPCHRLKSCQSFQQLHFILFTAIFFLILLNFFVIFIIIFLFFFHYFIRKSYLTAGNQSQHQSATPPSMQRGSRCRQFTIFFFFPPSLYYLGAPIVFPSGAK